jgi:hypothetical protein
MCSRSVAVASREKERPDVLTSRGGGSGRRLPHRRNGQEHPIKAAAAPSAVRKSSADPDRCSTNPCPTAPATVVSIISPGSSCASSEPSSAAEPFRSSRRHCLPAARCRHGYGHRVRGDGYRQQGERCVEVSVEGSACVEHESLALVLDLDAASADLVAATMDADQHDYRSGRHGAAGAIVSFVRASAHMIALKR